MEYIIIFAEWIYRIFLKGVKSFNLQIVNYVIKPASEYWLDFDVPCITFSLCWKCLKYENSESTFFDILLTVHLNIFILILTNFMH